MRKLFLVSVLIIAFTLASAQVSLDLSGEVEAQFGVVFDDGSIPVSSARLDFGVRGTVGSGFFPDATFDVVARGKYDAATGETAITLRDAYITVFPGPFDISLGNQVITWGSADDLNKVDVINPLDLSFPLEDEKIPVVSARVVTNLDDGSKLDVVVVPVFASSILPGERWQAEQTPPPGITVVGQEAAINNEPAVDIDNVQFGARFTGQLDFADGMDLSVSYFNGIRTTSTATVNLLPTDTPGEVILQPEFNYDNYQMFGLDTQIVTGPVVFRGEMAYTATDDMNGINPKIGNPSFGAVWQTEYNPIANLTSTLLLNYTWTKADLLPDNSQEDDYDFETALALSYAASERWTIEGTWVQSVTDGSGVLIPSLSYLFADGVSAELSGYVLYGTDDSTYGALKENSQIRASLVYAF